MPAWVMPQVLWGIRPQAILVKALSNLGIVDTSGTMQPVSRQQERGVWIVLLRVLDLKAS